MARSTSVPSIHHRHHPSPTSIISTIVTSAAPRPRPDALGALLVRGVSLPRAGEGLSAKSPGSLPRNYNKSRNNYPRRDALCTAWELAGCVVSAALNAENSTFCFMSSAWRDHPYLIAPPAPRLVRASHSLFTLLYFPPSHFTPLKCC